MNITIHSKPWLIKPLWDTSRNEVNCFKIDAFRSMIWIINKSFPISYLIDIFLCQGNSASEISNSLAACVTSSQKNLKFSSDLREDNVWSVIFATSCPSEAEMSDFCNVLLILSLCYNTQVNTKIMLKLLHLMLHLKCELMHQNLWHHWII